MSKVLKLLMWQCDFCDHWSLIFSTQKRTCRICGKPRYSNKLGKTPE